MTKQKILFVDDEESILQGLRRTLRRRRAEWDMEFVPSGQEALALMERWPADIVVSDMKMPVMDGNALLAQVRQRHPATIRIVLSGHVDPGQMLGSLGPSQQCLIKPCEPEALISAIQQSIEIRKILDAADLRELVSGLDKLPTPNAVISELVSKLDTPGVSIDTVAEILSKDVALTTMVLKLANSGFFASSSDVVSPPHAIKLLGFETVRSLVLTSGFFVKFDGALKDESEIARLSWRSLRLGSLAKSFAQAVFGDGVEADLAMCAGMLCHVGTLVLIANRPVEFAEAGRLADEYGASFVEAEQRIFGASHQEVGAYLLGLWGFSDPIVRAVAYHHQPGRCIGRNFDTLTALHAADGLIKWRASQDHRREDIMSYCDQDYLTTVGAVEHVRAWSETAPAAAAA